MAARTRPTVAAVSAGAALVAGHLVLAHPTRHPTRVHRFRSRDATRTVPWPSTPGPPWSRTSGPPARSEPCHLLGGRRDRAPDCRSTVRKGNRVLVKALCNDHLRIHVRFSAKEEGSARSVWKRTFSVKKRPFTACSARGTG